MVMEVDGGYPQILSNMLKEAETWNFCFVLFYSG